MRRQGLQESLQSLRQACPQSRIRSHSLRHFTESGFVLHRVRAECPHGRCFSTRSLHGWHSSQHCSLHLCSSEQSLFSRGQGLPHTNQKILKKVVIYFMVFVSNYSSKIQNNLCLIKLVNQNSLFLCVLRLKKHDGLLGLLQSLNQGIF